MAIRLIILLLLLVSKQTADAGTHDLIVCKNMTDLGLEDNHFIASLPVGTGKGFGPKDSNILIAQPHKMTEARQPIFYILARTQDAECRIVYQGINLTPLVSPRAVKDSRDVDEDICTKAKMQDKAGTLVGDTERRLQATCQETAIGTGFITLPNPDNPTSHLTMRLTGSQTPTKDGVRSWSLLFAQVTGDLNVAAYGPR